MFYYHAIKIWHGNFNITFLLICQKKIKKLLYKLLTFFNISIIIYLFHRSGPLAQLVRAPGS